MAHVGRVCTCMVLIKDNVDITDGFFKLDLKCNSFLEGNNNYLEDVTAALTFSNLRGAKRII